MARNILTFTTDDVETIIGRPPTDEEYRDIVKSLANNEVLTELVADTFRTFTIDRDKPVWQPPDWRNDPSVDPARYTS